MEHTAEFRVKLHGREWETVPVGLHVTASGYAVSGSYWYFNAIAKALKEIYKAPVRWNYRGSDLGHEV